MSSLPELLSNWAEATLSISTLPIAASMGYLALPRYRFVDLLSSVANNAAAIYGVLPDGSASLGQVKRIDRFKQIGALNAGEKWPEKLANESSSEYDWSEKYVKHVILQRWDRKVCQLIAFLSALIAFLSLATLYGLIDIGTGHPTLIDLAMKAVFWYMALSVVLPGLLGLIGAASLDRLVAIAKQGAAELAGFAEENAKKAIAAADIEINQTTKSEQ